MLYFNLGSTKQLNEIVFAGSHDAGITKGNSHAQTQNLDIGQQAIAGVRLFDIRIAGKGSQRDLTTYHGKPVRGRMLYGTWGEELQALLAQAKQFVTRYRSSEFLILKFDHCSNYEGIAAQCQSELGDCLYKDGGNLNTKMLRELAGKVIVVFKDGSPGFDAAGGILGIKSLKAGDQYDAGYSGLQYCGKGGTSPITPGTERSIKENIRKQDQRMTEGAAIHPDAMGMMYWTTTGVLGNIKTRNEEMWKDDPQRAGGNRMTDLWCKHNPAMQDLLPQAVDEAEPRVPPITNVANGGGAIVKQFLPNIIMIDFADADRCKTIYDLNKLLPNDFEEAAKRRRGKRIPAWSIFEPR